MFTSTNVCLCLWRPKESSGSPVTGVTKNCETVLGTKPTSSERVTGALNHWASSLPMDFLFDNNWHGNICPPV